MTAEPPLIDDERVSIPLRDGTLLAASVTRPLGEGPFPCVLARTPYDRTNQRANAEQWARAGYAFIRQDVRGRFDSDGEFYPFRDDPSDGEDTIEWIARQPWSNGRVGTTGASHVGTVQYLAAPRRPEHLSAAIPEFAPASVYHYWWYQGGAFRLSFNASWAVMLARDNLSHFPKRMEALEHDREQSWVTPESMLALDERTWFQRWTPRDFHLLDGVFGNDWFDDFMRHPEYGEFWRPYDFATQHAEMDAPMLHIGGWYDTFLQGTIDSYTGMRRNGRSERAREAQRLIVGPWKHVNWGQRETGEIDFGESALELDPFETRREWFDRWLRDGDGEDGHRDADPQPPVLIFVMGENVWRAEQTWPLDRAVATPYYLHGDGTLSPQAPVEEPPLSYDYDPADPVLTLGGCEWVNYPSGPFDQRPLDSRDDILRFESAPLDGDLEVTGQIVVRLFASSTAPDTDFTAKLIDVHPDGTAYNLCDGILRARYRESLERPTLMQPGEVYEFEIDLWSTSNLFRRGHRIRLDVSSSNFPRFDANPNTGAERFSEADGELRVASNTVYFERDRPSHVVLPVIPR